MNKMLLLNFVLRRFLRYKVKTFLLMLGISISVFTLTSALALGSGFKTAVLNYFSVTFLPDSVSLTTSYNVPGRRGISEGDVAAVLNELDTIAAWTPLVPGGSVNFSGNGKSQDAALNGTAAAAQSVLGHGTVAGEYFSEQDVSSRARVAVLGQTVSQALFGDESPLGQPLQVGTQVYEVKGVLNKLGSDPHGGDLDNIVLIPYTTLLQMNKREDLVNVRFRSNSPSAVTDSAERIASLMRRQHNLGPGQQDDFFVATSPAGKAAFERFEAMFRLLLPIICGVIFVISMLVLASIMLITVKDRTAEIGLRKAVGARSLDVETQFVLETLVIALCGGILGIALSYAPVLYVQSRFAAAGSEVSFLPGLAIIVLACVCSLLTGLLAAWLPARRAAALSPVEALR